MGEEDYDKLADHVEVPLSDGTTLYLKNQLTKRVKANYQAWISGNARRDLFEASPEMTGDAELDKKQLTNWNELKETHVTMAGAGKFRWASKMCIESLNELPGLIKMTQLLAEAAGKSLLDEKRCTALVGDPKAIRMVASSIKDIMSSQPNFLVPPEYLE